jgi:uncharacterized membrane protein
VCCPPSGTLAFVAATPRGLDRLVTFADAVVAIAITLLVLPLLDIPNDATAPAQVADLLRDHIGQIGTFLLSFAVIARLWLVHHRTFEHVRLYDGPLVQLTLVWLATIAFLPFPTELVGGSASKAAVLLYIGTLLVSSLVLTLTIAWVFAHPGLQESDDVAGPMPRPHWSTSAFLLVALLVTLVDARAGLWALLLLLLSGPLDSAVERVRRRRTRSAPPSSESVG